MKKKFFFSVFTLALLMLSFPSVSETLKPTSKCKDVGQLIPDADCSNYFYECDTNLNPVPNVCKAGMVFSAINACCGIPIVGKYTIC